MTAEQLDDAVARGLLVEGHGLDLKRELPAEAKNRDLAVDLAAFSVDGGILIVGIDEDESPPAIHPVELSGLAERIEQIGLASVDPPITVRTVGIATNPGSGLGVLVIVIPPSPMAPHMVDGKYRGRGDKTNYVMSDAEVRRVRDELRDHVEAIDDLLDDFARSAVPNHGAGPLLLVLARPVNARPEMLLTCANPNPIHWIATELLGGSLVASLMPRWSPDFTNGLPVEPRANGWAITRNSKAVLDLEIHENGMLRLRAGDLDIGSPDATTVNDVAINGLVKRVVLSAAAVGRACGHFGSWDFAVSVAPLRGRFSEVARVTLGYGMPAYSEEVYRQSATATFEHIANDPHAVVQTLLGRLNRAFGGPNAITPG